MLQIMETTEIPRVIWGASSSEMMSRVEKKLFAEKGFEAMAIIFARFATFFKPHQAYAGVKSGVNQVRHMLPVCVISWAFDKTSVGVIVAQRLKMNREIKKNRRTSGLQLQRIKSFDF